MPFVGPLDNGESFELTLDKHSLVARSGGGVNISAGHSHGVNDIGGNVLLKVRQALGIHGLHALMTINRPCSPSHDDHTRDRLVMARTPTVARVAP